MTDDRRTLTLTSLADTISRLRKLQSVPIPPGLTGDRLTDFPFEPNPGALRARMFVPDRLAPQPALVVVLHGCTQTAAGYDRGAGWSQLAERHGFALLFPEQQRANNPNLCFNWFQPEDTRRGFGEVESIHRMICAAIRSHGIDPARIFITGLSAGGAMTAAMLACYPDLFAGGAIIAGLPYGVATTVPDAFEQMRHPGADGGEELARLVQRASGHHDTWPTLSVWQGSADTVVHPGNADRLIGQWRGLHGLGARPDRIEAVGGGHRRSSWRDPTGRIVLDHYELAGMGHGTPLATRGADACGQVGPYMLDVGLSSTVEIARNWGLLGSADAVVRTGAAEAHPPEARTAGPEASASFDVRKVIEDALRAAGVMR